MTVHCMPWKHEEQTARDGRGLTGTYSAKLHSSHVDMVLQGQYFGTYTIYTVARAVRRQGAISMCVEWKIVRYR